MLIEICRFAVGVHSKLEKNMQEILMDHYIDILNVEHPEGFDRAWFYCETNPKRLKAVKKACKRAKFHILFRAN